MAKKRKTKAKTKTSSKTAVKSAPRLKTPLKPASQGVASSSTATIMSARQLTMTFIIWFIGHSLVFYLASRIFPEHVVLGTNVLSPLQSLMYSMAAFTLIAVGAAPVVEYVAMMRNKALKALDWIVIYFVVNAVGIWLVARFAEQLGLGISSWIVAVVLALVVDVVQGLLVTKAV